MKLRVMSYNVQGHASERNGRHLEQIAEVIRQAQPDVVGLQEIHCRTKRSGSVDQAARLAELTGMQMMFGRSCSIFGGEYGNAVLTRHGGRDMSLHKLPGKGEPRTVLECGARAGAVDIGIYVTHLTAWGRLRRADRAKQCATLASILAGETSPYIVMGDFNTSPGAPELSALRDLRLQRCGAERMVTFRLVRAHYDHIYVGGGGWTVGEVHAPRTGPSDHYPVIADLVLDV